MRISGGRNALGQPTSTARQAYHAALADEFRSDFGDILNGARRLDRISRAG
jgi:hypothetical protein